MAAKHASPDPTRRERTTYKPRHLHPSQQRRAPSYKRVPVTVVERPSSAQPARRERPASSPPSSGRTPSVRGSDRRRERAAALERGATTGAYLGALTPGDRTTVTGSALRGAGAGAATGAALGSAVGGPVGTAVGTAAGGVVGGAAGAVGGARTKKREQAARQPWRRALVVEFAVCIVIVALSPISDQRRDAPPSRWMKQMTAVMGLFFVLGLIAAAGRGAAKAAVGLGGLVTVALAVNEREIFGKLAGIFAPSGQTGRTVERIPGPGPQTGPRIVRG